MYIHARAQIDMYTFVYSGWAVHAHFTLHNPTHTSHNTPMTSPVCVYTVN